MKFYTCNAILFYNFILFWNRHWKIIHHKDWHSINNKIYINLMMVFFYKGQNTCV
jgi:hypothetical protein